MAALASDYLVHLRGRSIRYQERQATYLRHWILPRLGDVAVSEWTPAMSEEILTAARQRLAPATLQGLGSCLRSLVTYAHKARWLPREVAPMWQVSYSARATHQGQATGFIPRDHLPNDHQCDALFDALARNGEPAWALAMPLKHRSGLRWGELIALRPTDVGFEPHRVVRVHRAVEQSGRGLAIKTTKNTQLRTSIFPASVTTALRSTSQTSRTAQGARDSSSPALAGGLPSAGGSCASGTVRRQTQDGLCTARPGPPGTRTTCAM